MSEEIARTIAILSLVVTVGGLGLAVRSCSRPARVRIPLELAMLGISFAALPTIAAATGVHTDPMFAGGAVALGLAVGGFQGRNLAVEQKGDRLLARRSAPALAGWGAGIVLVQVASAAGRAGVLEAGQALSYFGAAMSFGLIVGRQTVLNRLALAAFMLLAAGLLGVVAGGHGGEQAAAQAPPPTPTPKVLKPAGTIDAAPFLAQVGPLIQSNRSELKLEFTDTGGAVKGDGQLVMEGFHVGVMLAIAEGLGSAIGEGLFGSSGASQPTSSALPADLANCRANWTWAFKLDGVYDRAAGKLSGTYILQQQFSDLRNCPARASEVTKAQPPAKAQPWSATFDGRVVTGTLTSTQNGIPSLTFGAGLPEERAGAAAPVAVTTPSAGAPVSPAATESGEAILPPPVDIEELTPGEEAGASLIGLGAVAIVAVGAMAQTAGAAPTVPTGKPTEEPELDTIAVPAGPQPITPQNVDWAVQNVARMAQEAGHGDIVRAIDRGLQAGTLGPDDMERLREVLLRRKELEEYVKNSDLSTRSDTDFFVGRCQEDVAWLAEKAGQPGAAWVIRHPAMGARIAAAIATEGASETFMTAWDVGQAVSNVVNRPGDTSASAVMKDAAAAAAIETAWQVLPGAALEKGVGIAMGHAAGDEARAIAQEGREGLEAASHGTTGELAEATARSADDGTGAAARSADDATGAAAHSADDAAETGMRRPAGEAPPEPVGPKPLSPATSLKEAPQGTQIPRERIREAGWTEDQLDDMQDIMKRNNTVYGGRASNVDSLPKLENGTSIPKPEPIKAKTTNALDEYLGTDPKYNGEVTLRQPAEPPFPRPAAGDAAADPLHSAVWDRFDARAKELSQLKGGVEELQAKGLVKWDPNTGLITNTGLNPDPATFGKSFGGDIDGVYLRDADTGAFIPDSDPRAMKVYQELRESKVLAQHRWETNVINDRVAKGGEAALSPAVDLHRKLEAGHLSGKEVTIEVGPNHVQLGPSNIHDADHGLGPDWLHTGGTPIVVDENLLGP